MGNRDFDCGRQSCDYFIDKDANCFLGTGDCRPAKMLEAESSEFHDRQLIEATRQIKKILEGLPADRQGRKLSFLHTSMGTLLAWVKPGATGAPKGAVTSKDDDAAIAKALKLKGYASAGAHRA